MGAPVVTIYSLTTCGWCAKTKQYFKQHGVRPFVIEFDTAGPDLQAKISAEMKQNGASGFPFVKIGRRVVRGYSPAEFEKALKA